MKRNQAQVYSVLLAPDASSTAARTANLDTLNADYASIMLNVSAEANTNATGVVVALLESDDTVVTNFAAITAHAGTVDNTAAACNAMHVDLKGRKRYLRLSVTPDTTTNGAVLVSAVAALDKDVKASDNDDNADSVTVS